MRFFKSLSTFGLTTLTLGIVVIVLLVVVSGEDDDNDSSSLDNGLGKHINWQRLDDGLALAKKEGKPLMLLIHKSWCGACKSLKPKFKESQKIAKLSPKFVMVNTMDDDEPPGDVYKPDGGYVPRLFFFDPEGDLLGDVVNENGNPEYKYYYYDEVSIVTSMEKVAALFPASDDLDSNDNSESQNQAKNEL